MDSYGVMSLFHLSPKPEGVRHWDCFLAFLKKWWCQQMQTGLMLRLSSAWKTHFVHKLQRQFPGVPQCLGLNLWAKWTQDRRSPKSTGWWWGFPSLPSQWIFHSKNRILIACLYTSVRWLQSEVCSKFELFSTSISFFLLCQAMLLETCETSNGCLEIKACTRAVTKNQLQDDASSRKSCAVLKNIQEWYW